MEGDLRVIRVQARGYLNVDNQTLAFRQVYTLAPTPAVNEAITAGFLIPEDAEGNFPDPVPVIRECCGG